MAEPVQKTPPVSERLLGAIEHVARTVGQSLYFRHYFAVIVTLAAGASFWIAYEFRFDFQLPEGFASQRFVLLPYVVVLKVFLFYLLRGHATNWRYVGLSDVPGLIFYCTACTLVLLLVPVRWTVLRIPRGVLLIDFFTTIVLVGGIQVGLRLVREKLVSLVRQPDKAASRSVLVIGAGDAGEMIIREIGRNPGSGLRVGAIFDDDRAKHGLSMHGIRVVGAVADIPAHVLKYPADMAIIAIPSATGEQMKSLYAQLRQINLPVKTLPPLNELMEESPKLMQLRDISIADLLGREEIRIDSEQVFRLIAGRTVLVTGAGGSIGSELCRQILRRKPGRLILMDRTENSLFHIDRELRGQTRFTGGCDVDPILCDVRDRSRLCYEFDRLRPDLVFHAAAHKHVPMQELNAAECFKNNVGATRAIARTTHEFGASTFLLISSDKAVNPTSIMGATKRVCEMYCQALSFMSTTRYLSVRFGNVLASEGSVVPIFMEQIAQGGPVTVTHPEVSRYFMTIPESVTLVLQAAAIGRSGQVMALEMGEPVRIVDLVRHLTQLMGKDDVPIQFIGLRPGEKLFEELCANDEVCVRTTHNKIKVYNQTCGDPAKMLVAIDEALDAVDRLNDPVEVRSILKGLVPEYWSESVESPLSLSDPVQPPAAVGRPADS